jgi:uncharacterized protein YybS (DUF2232 family)
VTSIADRGRSGSRPTGVRTALIAAGLLLAALTTPMPWGALWLIVPVAVAVAMLTSWRFGGWGVLVPLVLFATTLWLIGNDQMWAWWIPFAALTGAWMGIREEGGHATASDRAWLLLPLLMLSATLPWTAPYEDFFAKARDRVLDVETTLDAYRRILHWSDERIAEFRPVLEQSADLWRQTLPYVLPTILFLWMALLVAAGRSFAARAAALLRWPSVSRSSLRDWRLPDGAIWLALAGLGLLLTPWSAWAPTAWTLLISTLLAFCVQGIAVVESLMIARGMSGSLIVLTMVFVFTLATPAFVCIAAAMGISDVWLDYRRLESPSDQEQPGA